MANSKWLDDSLALVTLIHTGSGTDPKVIAAVDKLSTRLDANDANDADVKTVVDAVLKKLAELPPPPATVAVVSAVSPPQGSVNGGDKLTISGSNFTNATAVKFDATDALSFSVDNDSTITVVTPTMPAGTVPITVFNAAGNSAPGVSFIYA